MQCKRCSTYMRVTGEGTDFLSLDGRVWEAEIEPQCVENEKAPEPSGQGAEVNPYLNQYGLEGFDI